MLAVVCMSPACGANIKLEPRHGKGEHARENSAHFAAQIHTFPAVE
jgi:hypothetical protein